MASSDPEILIHQDTYYDLCTIDGEVAEGDPLVVTHTATISPDPPAINSMMYSCPDQTGGITVTFNTDSPGVPWLETDLKFKPFLDGLRARNCSWVFFPGINAALSRILSGEAEAPEYTVAIIPSSPRLKGHNAVGVATLGSNSATDEYATMWTIVPKANMWLPSVGRTDAGNPDLTAQIARDRTAEIAEAARLAAEAAAGSTPHGNPSDPHLRPPTGSTIHGR